MGAFAFCIRISPSHEFMGFLALHRNIAVRQRPIFRRRYHAPLTLVAIRACSSPCVALRRSARLSRDCSSSRRENAETFASLLVPMELSRSSLIFTPRDLKFIRPHTFYYKSAPKVTGGAVTFGAILYKSTGSRGIMPLAGCRGRAPARAQGAAPLGHFCQPGGEVRY